MQLIDCPGVDAVESITMGIGFVLHFDIFDNFDNFDSELRAFFETVGIRHFRQFDTFSQEGIVAQSPRRGIRITGDEAILRQPDSQM